MFDFIWKHIKSDNDKPRGRSSGVAFLPAERLTFDVDQVRHLYHNALEQLALQESDDEAIDAFTRFFERVMPCRGFRIVLADKNQTPVPFKDWDQKLGSDLLAVGDHLKQLELNGLASVADDGAGLCVPDPMMAMIPSFVASRIGLPSFSDVSVSMQTQGVPFTDAFSIAPEYRRNQRQLMSPVRDGLVIKIGGRPELLSRDTYLAAETVDAFNAESYADRTAKNGAWADVVQILNQTPFKKWLYDMNGKATVRAGVRVSVEVDDAGHLHPVFLRPKRKGGVVEFVPMLGVREVQTMARLFDSELPMGGHIAVGERSYVCMTPEVRSIVQVIRQAAKSTPETRAEFIANPTRALIKALSADPQTAVYADGIDDVFIETPEFLSDRVQAFGLWEPKQCAFMEPVKTEWFEDGPNRYAIQAGGEVVCMTLEQMDKFVKRIAQAKKEAKDRISFEGREYNVQEIDVDGVKNLLTTFRQKEKAKKDEEKAAEGKKEAPEKKDQPAEPESKAVYGPILKSNLESLEYRAAQKARDGWTHTLDGLKAPYSLYEHQKEALEWLQGLYRGGYSGSLLADDMGLGKTLQCLSFIRWVYQGLDIVNDVRPALVVAPCALLDNWVAEGEKYYGNALGEPLLLDATRIRSLMKLPVSERLATIARYRWVVTNYESIRDKFELFGLIDWSVMALDEAQRIKNPLSRLTETVKAVRTDFVLAMTGTPVENRFGDLWSIMDAAIPGFMGPLKDFQDQYEKTDVYTAGKEIHRLLTGDGADTDRKVPPLMLRRLKKDQLKNLPKKRVVTHPAVMSARQQNAYREAVQNKETVRDGKKVAKTGLERLMAVANLSLSAEPLKADTQITDAFLEDAARLRAAFDVLDAVHRENGKVLIFVIHVAVQDVLARVIRERYGMDHFPARINGKVAPHRRQAIVEEFQKGDPNAFDVLILTGRAAGVGLTITAATHVIHLERWWNPAVEDQCTDRAYRIGQTRDVTVHIPMAVFAPDDTTSFDARLEQFLAHKRLRSDQVLMPSEPDSQTDELVACIFKD